MKLRHRAPLFVLFTLAAATLLPLAGCSSDGEKSGAKSEAAVKLRRIEVQSATYEKMELLVIVVVENAGSTDIELKGGDASIQILGPGAVGDEEERDVDPDVLAQIRTDERHEGRAPTGTVPAYSETEVPYAITLPLPSDPALLEEALAWGRMNVNVKGSITLGGATETFDGTREVSAPELPEILLKESQVASVDGGQAGHVFFIVSIHNPNTFEITVDKFAWGMQVGGKEMRAVSDPSSELVPPAAEAEFEDSSKLDDVTFGPEVRDLLKQPRIPYLITGFYEVKGIRRDIKFEGEMEFAR